MEFFPRGLILHCNFKNLPRKCKYFARTKYLHIRKGKLKEKKKEKERNLDLPVKMVFIPGNLGLTVREVERAKVKRKVKRKAG